MKVKSHSHFHFYGRKEKIVQEFSADLFARNPHRSQWKVFLFLVAIWQIIDSLRVEQYSRLLFISIQAQAHAPRLYNSVAYYCVSIEFVVHTKVSEKKIYEKKVFKKNFLFVTVIFILKSNVNRNFIKLCIFFVFSTKFR